MRMFDPPPRESDEQDALPPALLDDWLDRFWPAYYLAAPTGHRGPMTGAELEALVEGGEADRCSKVWHPRLDRWVALGTLPRFAPRLTDAP
jgi:hypothetical protein